MKQSALMVESREEIRERVPDHGAGTRSSFGFAATVYIISVCSGVSKSRVESRAASFP